MTTIQKPRHQRRLAAVAGERKVRSHLTELGDAVSSLALLGARIVVGPAGIFVVDAWRFKNAPVTVVGAADDAALIIGGRDRTALAGALAATIPGIRVALSGSVEFLATPIMPVLCCVDADLVDPALELDGVRVRDLDGLAALVSTSGSLDRPARERLARHLAT